MVLKPEIIDAFTALGLTPDADQAEASLSYKKLALKHHPDRNYGDPSASARFQEIGHAWSICQRHFDHPYLSQVPDPADRGHPHGHGDFGGRFYSFDDEMPLDDDESEYFFRFMFEEMMSGRFSYARSHRYRQQRRGDFGRGVYTFSDGFADSQIRQNSNSKTQMKEQEEYQERLREFERELEEEEAERTRRAKEQAKLIQRRKFDHDLAFNLAHASRSVELRKLVEESQLNVCTMQPTGKTGKEAHRTKNFDTILHIASGSCDVETVEFLIDKGADIGVLNAALLTPFHVSISAGNAPVAAYYLSLYHSAKPSASNYQAVLDSCHPSKASRNAKKSTPLQLAVTSGSAEVVELVVKDATVHDVEKCWEELLVDDSKVEIRKVLLTKNGFNPHDDSENVAHQQKLSRNVLRKMKQLEDAKKIEELKKKRIEQQEQNRLKNLERKEKAAREEALKREKQEAAERRRQEIEEEKRRREAAEHELAKKVAEERRQKELEERKRREQEERSRREAEALAASEAQELARRQAEEQVRRQEEEAAKQRAAARKAKLAQKQREKQAAATAAKRLQAEEADRARVAFEEAERGRLEKERLKAEEERKQVEMRAQAQRILEEEARRAELAQEKEQIKLEAIKRKRAEQSARDKARYQKLRAEREKAKALEAANGAPQSTPNDSLQSKPKPPKRRTNSRPKPASGTQPTGTQPTPPQVPVHTRPKIAQPPTSNFPGPPSPPMTPEHIQTMAIPEDLFRYEPPPPTLLADTSTLSFSPPMSSKPESTPLANANANANTNTNTTRGSGSRASRGRTTIKRGRRGKAPAPSEQTESCRAPATPAPQPAAPNGVSAQPPKHPNVACQFFKRNACTRGSECQFSHVIGGRGRVGGGREDGGVATAAAPRQPLTAVENEISA